MAVAISKLCALGASFAVSAVKSFTVEGVEKSFAKLANRMGSSYFHRFLASYSKLINPLLKSFILEKNRMDFAELGN